MNKRPPAESEMRWGATTAFGTPLRLLRRTLLLTYCFVFIAAQTVPRFESIGLSLLERKRSRSPESSPEMLSRFPLLKSMTLGKKAQCPQGPNEKRLKFNAIDYAVSIFIKKNLAAADLFANEYRLLKLTRFQHYKSLLSVLFNSMNINLIISRT